MKILVLIFFISIALPHKLLGQNIWAPTNGPSGEIIKALAINFDGHVFAGSWGANGQIFRSNDNGNSWQQVSNWGSRVSVFSIIVNQNGYLFAGTNGGDGIYRSTDGGDSWHPANNGITNQSVNGLAANDSGFIVAATDFGVFFSPDNGLHWTDRSTGLPASYILAVAAGQNNTWFVGTFGNGVYRSTDNGITWEEKNNGLNHLFINSIVVDPNRNIFLGPETGSEIYRSTDNGETWVALDNGLPANEANYILATSIDGTILAAQNFEGVFISYDSGNTWNNFNAGLTNREVRSLVINTSGIAFAGVGSQGVYRTLDPITPLRNAPPELSKVFELQQNYPNPFNSGTVIKFDVPHPSHVVLNVFDIQGRKVTVLLNQKVTAGKHQMLFDSHGLPSGLYFYQLATDGFTDIKKMVLIR